MEIIDFTKSAINNSLKLHGRYYRQNGILWMNFSGSGIEYSFYGTSSSIKVVATATKDKINRPYFMIFVDDLTPKKYEINQPEMEILLVENLLLCRHHIRIMKISECSSSHVGYLQVETDGKFLSFEEKEKIKIEIYGDSITNGYGVEAKSSESPFKTSEENFALSYAYLFKENLDVDIQAVSVSGFPLHRSIYNEASKIKTIPDMLTLASFDFQISFDEAPKWDNRLFIPSLIVIALGTNDGSVGENHFDNAGFKKQFLSFVQKLYKTYGSKLHILIFEAILPLPTFVKKAYLEAIKENHLNIDLLESKAKSVGGIMPVGGHPNKEMHRYAANELSDYINKNYLLLMNKEADPIIPES
jgi:lysophospholipase L1-like esterase